MTGQSQKSVAKSIAMSNPPTPPSEQLEDPRVRFAAERTLLAWMRTGLALMGFGFVVARFGLFLREIAAAGHVTVHQQTTGWSLWIGTGLIALGVAANLLAAFEYCRFLQWAKRGQAYAPRTAMLAVVVSVILALLATVMMVYLILLGT
jgi:putative membrane protein